MEGKYRYKMNDLIWYGLTIIKFLYPVFLALLSIKITHTPKYLCLVATESFLIFAVTNVIAHKNKLISYIMGAISLFVIYTQAIVLCFSGVYVQMIMLTNLGSLGALSGKVFLYASTVIISLTILILPVKWIPLKGNLPRTTALCLTGIFVAGIGINFIVGSNYSPIVNTALLLDKAVERSATERKIRDAVDSNEELSLDEFYSDAVGDGHSKPKNLPDNPNIILIFVEGMSENILNDRRNIMPNLASYAESGVSFENYYNHTAATYRGIIGQLYSSHQYHNGDTNLLISLQSILKNEGYDTTFVNAEPENEEFTKYLNSFGYDRVVSGDVLSRSLTDGESYETIYDSLDEGVATGRPQFITAYTFGTHVTFDSDEVKYGDGKNRLLNRFYNCDYQFGRFMNKLKAAEYSRDTVVIFTTDHATYVDDDYTEIFYPKYKRYDIFCDTIPLIIWYEGIKPFSIDVGGRNSLGLAPTILDYLDIDSPNYFLGSSLFLPMRNPEMETVFCVPDSEWTVKTEGGRLRRLTDEESKGYMKVIERYMSLTMRTDTPIP